ncbi:transcription factor Tfb4 [Dendrothele bispora CBS 962.96]|uniref:General transcription and DNA repair factor IIH subunit TFB4 n=1 Tax=Dendrothele bispora (strain CBS 962.96) TaxID=1314807 RepID=A0A4S8MI90_DENBC|nr:transcription factor Tfb4 [Dendrothele bispora CBS 962.96]
MMDTLCVVIDLSVKHWQRSATASDQPLSLPAFLIQLVAFLNAYSAGSSDNALAVFAAFPGKSLMLYSSTDTQPQSTTVSGPNSYPPFQLLDDAVVSSIIHHLESLSDSEQEAPCPLVGALTKALCFINRLTLDHNTNTSNAEGLDPIALPDPRVLILSVSPDITSSYIPIMNSIFSAQKLKVTIDACQLSGPDSVFLQQAAHLTGGSYLYLERRDALLQHLTMTFLPSPSVRGAIAVPTQDKVDFRAACFCHKNIVDIGFVCSVCLSIFCQPVPVCSTCRTKFPMKTLQRLNASRPPAQPRPAPIGTNGVSKANGSSYGTPA